MAVLKIVLVLAIPVAVLAALWRGRNRRWGLAVWLPAVTLPLAITAGLLREVPGKLVGPGSDTGFVAMSSGFYLILALPLILLCAAVWVGALICWPRREARNWQGGISGILICATGLMALHSYEGYQAEVEVVDARGRPVPGQNVNFSHTSFVSGSSRKLGSAVTNANGLAVLRVPRGSAWSAQTTTEDGTKCTVSIVMNGGSYGATPDYRLTRWSWFNPKWGWASSVGVIQNVAEQRRLTLRLRNADEVVSKFVVATMRRQIALFGEGKPNHLDFDTGPEKLEVLPDFLAMAKAHSDLMAANTHLLDGFADALSGAFGVVASHDQPGAGSEIAISFAMLAKWIGAEPKNAKPLIESRLQGLAEELVNVSEPLWRANGPVGVGHLGRLAKPYAARMLSALEQMPADERRPVHSFAHALKIIDASVEQVAPFFDSKDRAVAVAALGSVSRKLAPDELQARLTALSRPGERDWIQRAIQSDIESLLLELKARQPNEPR